MGTCPVNSVVAAETGCECCRQVNVHKPGCNIIWIILVVLCIQLAGNSAAQLLSTRLETACHVVRALKCLAGRCLLCSILEGSHLVFLALHGGPWRFLQFGWAWFETRALGMADVCTLVADAPGCLVLPKLCDV
jgi:hypothetical protein